MKRLQRLAGILWILLGPVPIIYLVRMAASEIEKKPVLDTWVQWAVFIGIFIPIAFGMVLFGYFALTGAYDE